MFEIFIHLSLDGHVGALFLAFRLHINEEIWKYVGRNHQPIGRTNHLWNYSCDVWKVLTKHNSNLFHEVALPIVSISIRKLEVPESCNGVARFAFDFLCGQPVLCLSLYYWHNDIQFRSTCLLCICNGVQLIVRIVVQNGGHAYNC